MIQECNSLTSDVTVIKRLIFAARNISSDTPGYWDLVTSYGFKSSHQNACTKDVQVFIENLHSLEEESFINDRELKTELYHFDGYQGHPIGIILISNKSSCEMCGGRLLVRADRASFPVVYTEDMGTIPGTHFRKYCENQSKGCHFTQHYGFCSNDETNAVVYDKECFKLPYFMSTNMTVFQITLLQYFTAELLIGQVSYKQKADIYNY